SSPTRRASDLDKATLTLPDGRVISLDEMTVGTLRQEAGDQLVKDSEGSLFYKRSTKSTERSAKPNYHTMNIPKGGQYKLTLPDGSRVWLNSASSLKYATNHFERNRTVTLTGEAYFEVKSDSRKPFRVITDRQNVTVLGRNFNSNSYPYELGAETTLIEGSANISVHTAAYAIRLSPGQVSFVDGTGLSPTVRRVETEQAIAWIK